MPEARAGEPPTAVLRLAEARGRAAAADEQIHAFLAMAGDSADSQAAAVDSLLRSRSPDQPVAPGGYESGGGPVGLMGMAVAVKDNLCTRGLATTCGSAILEGWIPPYDATVVTRLTQAGAVVVGKTNMDEFAMGSSTEFSAFGPTRNPHDLTRVPGGSSGGSAAAVAAGVVRVALGSDTGGSVRQPASHCGVVGVKPTYGRVSRYGLVAYASSLDQVGVLAASVAEAAAGLEAIMGHDPADSTSLDLPVEPLGPALGQGVDGVRVGLLADLMGPGVAPAVRSAVGACASALADAGAAVEEVRLDLSEAALAAYYLLATAEASSNLARFDGVRYGRRVAAASAAEMMVATRTRYLGEEVQRRIILGTFALSAGYYDDYYGQAQRVRTLVVGRLASLFGDHDVVICPTSPGTAFGIGELIDDPLALYLTDVSTVTANLAGIPAVSVPFGADGAALPIGVQVMAPALGEALLMQVAAQIERMAPELPRPRVWVGGDSAAEAEAARLRR
ncbi:MAG: Asp-tRNA(Asn)/Glu-tRNA(Gln) amidotransferase subunit GatA [Acidimicrobiales bacterium]